MEETVYEYDEEPGVFETPDVTIPEYRPYRIIEEKDNVDIDKNNIQVSENSLKFKQKVGDTNIEQKNLEIHKKLLFKTYSINKSNRIQTFETGQEIDEITEETKLTTEEIKSLLVRLNLEAEELELELEEEEEEFEEEDINVIDLINKANRIQHQNELFNYKANNNNLEGCLEGDILHEKLNSLYLDNPEQATNKKAGIQEKVSQALDLEARVTSLEELLGPETLAKAELPNLSGIHQTLQTLLDYLDKLEDPNYLATINRRVKELIGELDRLITLRDNLKFNGKDVTMFHPDATIDLETKAKVDGLFALKNQFDLYITVAPGFQERFKQLGNLHQELIGLTDTLNKLKQDIQETEEINNQFDAVYNEVFENLKVAQIKSRDQFFKLDNQINELTKLTESLV